MAGLWSGASGISDRIVATDLVVDERRFRKQLAAVDDTVADRVDPAPGQLGDDLAQRCGVVADPSIRPPANRSPVLESTSWYFTDELPVLSTSTRTITDLRPGSR